MFYIKTVLSRTVVDEWFSLSSFQLTSFLTLVLPIFCPVPLWVWSEQVAVGVLCCYSGSNQRPNILGQNVQLCKQKSKPREWSGEKSTEVPSSDGVRIMQCSEVQNFESGSFERCNNRIKKVKADEVVRN